MGTMIERIVRFTVNGQPMPSFVCTPEALDELAAGYLLTQGHIASAKEIASVSVDGLSVDVRTANPLRPACPVEVRVASLAPVQPHKIPDKDTVRAIMRALLSQETYFGTHALALCAPSETVFREDIGRHNAMDKIIGYGALRAIDLCDCIVAATGRISLEMLLKAASVGVPVLLSKKYPSDLSVETANRLGIRIVANAASESPIVYAIQS